MNSTYHTMEALVPIIQVRQSQVKNQRITYSVTLDQTRWSSWKENYPVLLFITDGP